MKIKIYVIFLLLMWSCSSDSSTDNPIVEEPDTTEELPVANDDVYEVREEEELIMSSLLDNDTVVNSARITSFDEESANAGEIIDNRDGTYTYIPADGFVGEDSFSYTLCDRATSPNCSQATVVITVVDEGSPEGQDDVVNAVMNRDILFKDLLENDTLTDDATITSLIDTETQGTGVLTEDGWIAYSPAEDFTGNDIFKYVLCDDDETCVEVTVTVTVLQPIIFNIPASLDYYYGDIAISEDQELNYEVVKQLTIENHTTILSYGQRHNYLYNADADLTNSDNVILMYSGESRYWEEYTSGSNSHSPQTFNTEHIYPQSRLVSSDAVTDLHHLRSCDDAVNSLRSNNSYTDGSGDYALVNGEWFPGDDWKGDVARMIFYLNVRYGETFSKVGTLELFLKWNIEDPVSDFEVQRNTVIEAAQGVRNPFIDNPYLATLIWGGDNAENKWE